VAHVGRVERATEDADSFTAAVHGRSLGAALRAYRASRRKTHVPPSE
jgi:hypothetical protein